MKLKEGELFRKKLPWRGGWTKIVLEKKKNFFQETIINHNYLSKVRVRSGFGNQIISPCGYATGSVSTTTNPKSLL